MAELADRERLLDEAQGREAEERRNEQLQEEYENAAKRLSESKAELDKLRAEYGAMAEKIRLAEWRFNEALRAFNKAREKSKFGGSDLTRARKAEQSNWGE